MITISIIEDQRDMRESLVACLGNAPGLRCVGAHATGEEALRQIPKENPDVVLMDINLPGMSGIQCVARLKERLPKIQVLMLTTYDDGDVIFDSLRAGANGYLLKNMPQEELLQAVQQVHAGGAPMSLQIARKVINDFHQTKKAGSELERLTDRELEILRLLAKYPLNPANWRTETRYVLTTVPAGYSPEQTVIYKVRMGYKKPSPAFEGPLFRNASNPDIVHCPGDTRFKRPLGSGFAWDSYSGVNGLNGESGGRLTKRTQLLHPSDRFLWVEGADGRGENVGSWNMANYGTPSMDFSDAQFGDSPADFHGGTANFSFADGHAAPRKWLDAITLIYARSQNVNKDSGSSEKTAAQSGSKRDQQWVGSHYPNPDNP